MFNFDISDFSNIIRKTFNNEKYLENIKNNNLINFYTTLPNEEKRNFTIYYLCLKKLSHNELNENEKIIFNSFNAQIDSLLNEDMLLTDNEINFLSYFIGGLLLENDRISDEYITKYVNNCYLKNENHGIVTDLVILLKYFFNIINNYNNRKTECNFDYKTNGFASFNHEFDDNNTTKISIDKNFYDDLFMLQEKINLAHFYYMIVFQLYAILHEYRHCNQFNFLDKNDLSSDEEIMKKEIIVSIFDNNFYNNYHRYFLIEKDANNFALNNLDYFIKSKIPEEYYNKSKNKILDALENIDLNLPNFDFKNLLEIEYEKYKNESLPTFKKK